MSEDLLCTFDLLKPLDGAALREELTKAKRKRCVLVSLCPLMLCLHMVNSILTTPNAVETRAGGVHPESIPNAVETRAGEVHPKPIFLEGGPPKRGVNLTAVVRRINFFLPFLKTVNSKK